MGQESAPVDTGINDPIDVSHGDHSESKGRMFAELLGGGVGGILQAIVGHPLDTIKVGREWIPLRSY